MLKHLSFVIIAGIALSAIPLAHISVGKKCESAKDVLVGKDLLTDLSWAIQHGKPTPPLRIYIDISHCLLEEFPELKGQEKINAELFLCQNSIGPPLKVCSETEIKKRLNLLAKITQSEK